VSLCSSIDTLLLSFLLNDFLLQRLYIFLHLILHIFFLLQTLLYTFYFLCYFQCWLRLLGGTILAQLVRLGCDFFFHLLIFLHEFINHLFLLFKLGLSFLTIGFPIVFYILKLPL